uniref:AsIV-cont00088-ORF1 n=1 Tax=Apophua simplicipes ichnovirus TaxID=1329648 RepID=S5DYX6_9VIRU|nr:AsIV-cont00088-ORF1 [Apophua simplicipes ichnovirus]
MEKPTIEVSPASPEAGPSNGRTNKPDRTTDPWNHETDHLDHKSEHSMPNTPKMIANITEKMKEMNRVSNDIEALVRHPIYGCVQKIQKEPVISWKNLEKAVENRDTPGSEPSRLTSDETGFHRNASVLQLQNHSENQRTVSNKWTVFKTKIQGTDGMDEIDKAIWFWRLMCVVLSVGLGILMYEVSLPDTIECERHWK